MASYTWNAHGLPVEGREPFLCEVITSTALPADALAKARITCPNASTVYLKKMRGVEANPKMLELALSLNYYLVRE